MNYCKSNNLHKIMKLGTFAIIGVFATALSAYAASMATADQIKSAVSGNTLQGTMVTLDSAYSEHYMADGTIRGNGYTGKWTASSDGMCYQYGSDPAKCWGASLNGAAITWYKEGKVDGIAVIITGNPNNF